MKKEKISALVISAHPDDEVSCAGTLLKLKAKGASISEIVLTDASEGRDRSGKTSTDVAKMRRKEMEKVASFLGMQLFFLDEEDLGLKYSKKLMLKVVKIIREVKPTVVFLMNKDDFHPDHRAAFEVGIEAVKWAATGIQPELGASHRTKVILQMNGMWPIRPDLMVDVTEFENQIVELFKLHGSQADSRAVNFEKAMLTIYGYQHRTRPDCKAEAFNFCAEFPSSGLIEL